MGLAVAQKVAEYERASVKLLLPRNLIAVIGLRSGCAEQRLALALPYPNLILSQKPEILRRSSAFSRSYRPGAPDSAISEWQGSTRQRVVTDGERSWRGVGSEAEAPAFVDGIVATAWNLDARLTMIRITPRCKWTNCRAPRQVVLRMEC